jgi:hypothetical protein
LIAMKLFKASLSPLLLLLLVITGCIDRNAKKPTNWRIDYEKISKDPYSLYLMQQSLPLLFPNAKVEQLKPSYRLNNLGYSLRKNKDHSLLIMIGQSLYFNEGEIDSLVSLVQEGQQILLIASNFDETLLTKLQLEQGYNESVSDTLQKIYLKNFDQQYEPFTFRFKKQPIQQQFKSLDTAKTYFSTIGTNQDLQPNLIIFTAGKGKLLLHTAPLAFSNYFLLQEKNKNYLKYLFSYIEDPVSNVYFVPMNYREITDSNFGVIWDNLATRTAFLLCILALVVYILFEMKRRQKIIPIIKPLDNSSVAFTETIGRLYYNNKNHTNLAEKMAQHFLEFVRSNYYLNTNILDAEFVKLLSAKSGIEIAKTDSLIYNIKMVNDGLAVDEAFLFALYTQIQEYYNGK